MFGLIKQVFIVLLSFGKSLATKFMALNNEPCMIRPTLIDLNSVGLNCYTFMISLDKCDGSYNAADDLSKKICVPSKTNDVNVKAFNVITRIIEAKTIVKTYFM